MAGKWEKDEALFEEDKKSDTQRADSFDLPSSSSSLPPRGSLRSMTSTCSNAEPPPLPTRPPGKIVFANPSSFITELYPPFIDVGEEEEGGGGSVLAQVVLRQLLTLDSPDALRTMISGRWLEQCYKYPTMWQWLFQITARSSEPLLSNRAFQCLIQLLQAASQRSDLGSVWPPVLADVMDVLVCLGVDQTRLLPCDEGMEVSECPAAECDDVFHSPKSLVGNVKNIVKYLAACIRLLPKFYSEDELVSLINLLLNVSLDPLFCGAFAEADANVHVAQCVGEAIAAFPEENWTRVARRLTSLTLGISSHHHDRLHLVTVVGSALRPRQGALQRMLCRECIARTLGLDVVKREEQADPSNLPVVSVKSEGQAAFSNLLAVRVKSEGQVDPSNLPGVRVKSEEQVEPSNLPGVRVKSEEQADPSNLPGVRVKSEEQADPSNLPVVRVKTEDGQEMDFPEAEVKSKNVSIVKPDVDTDCSFAYRVVLHYYKQKSESYDYYSIYSIMTMLSLFMHPSEMKWPTEEEKKRFGTLLGALSSDKIRDNAMRPERMPVKELIIRMKLEMKSSYKTVEPRQTSIDSYFA